MIVCGVLLLLLLYGGWPLMAFVHYRLRRHHALGSALISSVAALGVGLFIGTYIAGVRVTLERADSHAVSTPGRLVLQHRLGRWSILDS
jgi:hypothetical protein